MKPPRATPPRSARGQATVTLHQNPFAPGERETRRVRAGVPLARLAPPGKGPLIAAVNGGWVLRADGGWQKRKVAAGDHVTFVRLPEGGGGRGGSNPLRVFLSLALMVVAGPLAGGLSSALGIGVGAARAGILLGGSALINAALPVRAPGGGRAPSPTYSIDAQGNAARLGAPIPVQYGRVRSYPDFAALPYAEFAGDEQYLYQLFCLGCGEYDVEGIFIEDTPISSFGEVETQVCGPGEPVTLFPTQVVSAVEVAGQELAKRFAGTWTRSGTTVTITRTAHGLTTGQAIHVWFETGGGADGAYAVATVVDANSFTVTTAAVGTSGNCWVDRYVGGLEGFTATAAGQVAQRLSIDIVLPQGLYRLQDDGDLAPIGAGFMVEVRPVDEAGAPTGAWVTALDELLVAKTATPLRRSYPVPLPAPGRYQVRMRRTTEGAGSNRYDQVLWGGLRAYLAEDQQFGNVTVIAVKMRATNNLSLQASRRVNVISTRKLPVWNGTSWSAPVATRSIAWAFADAARNSDYSVGRADRKIDLARLLALDAEWAARGDTFNFRFDQQVAWWDALQTILMAGRARPFMQASILRAARDRPQSVPVAMFSMRNIARDSFNVEWLMPPSHRSTALDVHYFDAETWAPEKVRVDLWPGGSAPAARMELPGVDNPQQATREGSYQAAATRYRRRLITFETEMEGFSPEPLELITIQHNMPGWGAQAEVRAWRPADRMLTLTEPVTVTAQTVVALRRPNGSPWGPVAVTQGPTPYDVALAEAPDFTPVTAQDRERTHVAIGTSAVWSMPALFLSGVPRGNGRVAVEAIGEDPAVHTAELGVTPRPRRASLLPRRVTRPEVSGLFARPVPGDATRAVLGWRPAPGADVYRVEMAEGFDPNDPDAVWTPVAEISAASISLPLLHPRRTMVRVQGIGLAAGPWTSATLGSLIGSFWVGGPADPFWVGTGTDPFWRTV